jgi:hypothetical protein
MRARLLRLAEVRLVRSSDRLIWVAACSLTAASATVWLGWAARPSDALAIMMLLLTGAAAVPMALLATRERRTLAVLLVLVVPMLGPLASAMAIVARGRGGEELIHDPAARSKRIDGAGLARTLTRALPACEALVSGDAELRRATISRLAGRANAEDLTVLRWARTRPDAELAVEIALAFEDIGQRFENKLGQARAEAGANPSYATHHTLIRVIADAILAGIVDAPLIAKLASEARIHYDAAVAIDPDRAQELLATRARLELAVGRPEQVIVLLVEQVTADPRGELTTLYLEAAYAVRAFDVITELEARIASAA